MRSNAPYELSRTLTRVPNTSNDISLGCKRIRSVRRLRPVHDRSARGLPGLRHAEHAVIVEAAAADLHADRQAGRGECGVDRDGWLLGEIPRHRKADVLERMLGSVARRGPVGGEGDRKSNTL